MTLVDARDDLEDVRDTGDDTVLVDTHVVHSICSSSNSIGGRTDGWRAGGHTGRRAGRQTGRRADRQAGGSRRSGGAC